jgi:hypothetical protein
VGRRKDWEGCNAYEKRKKRRWAERESEREERI